MLTRTRAAYLGAAVLIAMGTGASPSIAGGPECKKQSRDGGVCKITIKPAAPVQSGNGVITPIGGSNTSGGSSTRPQCVQFGNEQVPCSSNSGPWSNQNEAYCQPASPQPPASAAVWGGRTTGVILNCSVAPGGPPGSGGGQTWAPDATAAGGAPVPTMTPAEAAAIVIRQMDLRGPTVGIVPEDRPDRLGVVGMPVWMWVAQPGPTTYGPQTITGSAGGITITATAKVTGITWHMGDGAVVNCAGPGTPYQDSYGKRPSPDCGHMYSKTSRSQPGSRYRILADSHWQIDWTGGGASGQQALDVEGETSVAIGELQALITS